MPRAWALVLAALALLLGVASGQGQRVVLYSNSIIDAESQANIYADLVSLGYTVVNVTAQPDWNTETAQVGASS